MGVIYSPLLDRKVCYDALIQQFGSLLFESPVFDFSHTDYYVSEMGPGLKRQFLCFESSVSCDLFFDIKHQSIVIEKQFMNNGCRLVNLDPGGMASHHYVLLSTKNYAHRVYLNQGIYVELCYLYQKGGFRVLPWTYPDYCDPSVSVLFEHFRTLLG